MKQAVAVRNARRAAKRILFTGTLLLEIAGARPSRAILRQASGPTGKLHRPGGTNNARSIRRLPYDADKRGGGRPSSSGCPERSRARRPNRRACRARARSDRATILRAVVADSSSIRIDRKSYRASVKGRDGERGRQGDKEKRG